MFIVSGFGNWLRIPPTHCGTPAWCKEFEIYQETKKRKLLIGIGCPPIGPEKTYECPILEARRCERLLDGPLINSQADVARELGITRARVNQILGLLKLPKKIQRVLLELNDQKAIRYFSERRLRPLFGITDWARHMEEFRRMLGEGRPSSQSSFAYKDTGLKNNLYVIQIILLYCV